MLPAGKGCHGVALHQGGDVAAHAVAPGAAVWVEFGGVGDGVADGAQAGGHAVEGGEVQAWQAAHGTAEVNSFHGESLPGHARAVEWCQWGRRERKLLLVGRPPTSFPTCFKKSRDGMLASLTKPERYRMKRLTEWINLIAAVLRLIIVIVRTGWL